MMDVTYWLKCIHEWFPNLYNETYFLPPVHFNCVSYSIQNVAQVPILVPQLAAESDHRMRDDKAQRLVLNGLHALAEKSPEVMVVVSQLWFGNYLNKPSYAAAAAHFPRPVAMDKQHRQGDFDVLIIHSQCGLITGEIKSVGENLARINVTQQESDDILARRIQQALQQLNKSEKVLRFLVSDLPGVYVTKVLILPFVTRCQLVRVINSHPEVGQAMCSCLGFKTTDEATRLCLCTDQLSSSTAECHELPNWELCEWWLRIKTKSKPLGNSSLSRDCYEQLVARFCGPATTVDIYCITAPRLEIRTTGEGVAAVGQRMAQLCLYPNQVQIMNTANPRVFLSGPPGTGKTVMLYLKGVQWLHAGHDVHIVSTWQDSSAACYVLEHQLLHTESIAKMTNRPSVHRHDFDFDIHIEGDIDVAVDQLETASLGGQLCVIADEVDEETFEEFCTQLVSRVPGVYVWVASVYNNIVPACMVEEKVTVALRSPPVVVNEIERDLSTETRVHGYTSSGVAAPTDGPDIRYLYHSNAPNHAENWQKKKCEQCGRDIAGVLRELHVGVRDRSVNTSNLQLQYRDVLVLCGYPRDGQVDNNGQVTLSSSGLVRGLRESGVPVHVVGRYASDADIRDVALSLRDEVTVSKWKNVRGLERKIVVVTKSNNLYRYLLLNSSSRCTSLLVIIV